MPNKRGATLKVPVTLEVLGPPDLAAVSSLEFEMEWVLKGKFSPLVIEVTRGSNPKQGVSDVSVEWVVTAAGSTNVLSRDLTTTGAGGSVSITLNFGEKPRAYTVTATCAVCVPTSVRFTVTAMEIQLALEKSSVLPRPLGPDMSDNQSKVTVKVLPVEYKHSKNREVTLKVIKAAGGGHDSGHVAPRPTGSVTNLVEGVPARGACLTLESVNTDPDDPFSPTVLESPKARGEIVTDIGTAIAGGVYTACEIGGTETIEASIELMDDIATGTPIKNGRMIKKERTIRVEVPGLEPLPFSSNYIPTGEKPGVHPVGSNHFALNGVNNKILKLTSEYLKLAKAKLRINDMSLVMGGVFDICAKWVHRAICDDAPVGGHGQHRTGNSVDISKSAVDQAGILVAVNRILLVEIIQMREWMGCRMKEGPIHVEFDSVVFRANKSGWCFR